MKAEPGKQYKRIVIKVGTNVLTGGSHTLDQAHMVEMVRQCALLYARGCEIVICTSAAVAVGRSSLNYPLLPDNIASKQLLAAVGQTYLMQTWQQLFNIYNIHVGQILIGRADVENRRRFLNARDALSALLEHRIIPIINENDAVATEEIRVGDNDNLSALVATLVNADLLIMLTDQPGLFTADPRTNPHAELIPEVHRIDEHLKELAGASSSGLGIGGMATKLQAADTARRAGTDVLIAAGRDADVILGAAQGDAMGTLFRAVDSPIESRKRWLLAGATSVGQIVVDEGAKRALCAQGKSLLPAGITDIEGAFDRGDIVSIVGPQRNAFARGLSSYTSDDLHTIKGSRSEQITNLLGYTYGPNVVHRNDMILLLAEPT